MEVLVGQSNPAGDARREIGVPEQTACRWHRDYGGMQIEQLRRLKELNQENGRLNRRVAD